MKRKSFLVIGFFWLSIVAILITTKEYTLRTGAEVLLKTRPVDPRDLFRGDYVILSYDISRFDADKMQSSYIKSFKENDVVYVSLNTQKEYASIRQVHLEPPIGELYMKGRITRVRGDNVTVEYGIESYFVPEGKGRELERHRNRGKVDVLAAVDRRGNTMIKKLYLNKEEVTFE